MSDKFDKIIEKDIYRSEIKKYKNRLEILKKRLEDRKYKLAYFQSLRDTTEYSYNEPYFDTKTVPKGDPAQIERLKKEIEELTEEINNISNNMQALASENAKAGVTSINNESIEINKEIEQEMKALDDEQATREASISAVKRAYKKGSFGSRVVRALNGKKPNWKKITHEYTDEEIEFLKSSTGKNWDYLSVLLSDRRKLDNAISTAKEYDEDYSPKTL